VPHGSPEGARRLIADGSSRSELSDRDINIGLDGERCHRHD
jgi:hypothetical protein